MDFEEMENTLTPEKLEQLFLVQGMDMVEVTLLYGHIAF